MRTQLPSFVTPDNSVQVITFQFSYLQGIAVEPAEKKKIQFGPDGGCGSKDHKTDLRPVLIIEAIFTSQELVEKYPQGS